MDLISTLVLATLIAGGNATCETSAAALVERVERQPMKRRATLIIKALRSDAKLRCGVGAFESPPVPGLDPNAGPIEIAPRLADDVDAALLARVQSFAHRLKQQGTLTPAHQRLLQVLLISSALQ